MLLGICGWSSPVELRLSCISREQDVRDMVISLQLHANVTTICRSQLLLKIILWSHDATRYGFRGGGGGGRKTFGALSTRSRP